MPSRPTRPEPVAIPLARRRAFGTKLRAWFRGSARDLPWRRTRDPYHVLVSELMLQQTQVARVVEFYDRFLTRFPSLADVARARPAHVREAWEGLGYYARARNLHALARHVTDRGRAPERTLPSDPDELRALPGIGAYTAGAVASFAYEKRAPLVDTNVARVLARAFAPHVDGKSTRGQKVLWEIARDILPRTGRATWVHNQALMELGALVCTARVAHCSRCPVRRECVTGGTRDEGRDGGSGKREAEERDRSLVVGDARTARVATRGIPSGSPTTRDEGRTTLPSSLVPRPSSPSLPD